MLVLLVEVQEGVAVGEHRLDIREQKGIEEGKHPDHESIHESFLQGHRGKVTDRHVGDCVGREINRMDIQGTGA